MATYVSDYKSGSKDHDFQNGDEELAKEYHSLITMNNCLTQREYDASMRDLDSCGTVEEDSERRAPDSLSGSVPAFDIVVEEEYGWCGIYPWFCQRLRNPKVVLFWLCWAGATQGMVVNGFVSVSISTIEKRFDLQSTETGFIASAYDIASVLCLIPVSYFGGIGHKPRWLGIGVFLMGLGSLLCALPHFTTTSYTLNFEKPQLHMCFLNETNIEECDVNNSPASLSGYKYVFILGQLLHGAGATPLYTLGVTYLDENLKAKNTPVYVGIYYALAIIGPALGYVLGGELLKIYTEPLTDTSNFGITPDSPKWIGAWWIGFLMCGMLAFIICCPLGGFPKSLPGSAILRAERISEAYQGADNSSSKPGIGGAIRDIPLSLKVLLTNPTFMFLNMAGASEGLLLSGFTAFAPKFVQSQFSISAGWAAQLVGFTIIPAGGGGTFIGGCLIKKMELKCAGIIKLCIITTVTSLMFTLIFLVQCPDGKFAGINVGYGNKSHSVTNLSASCNADCHCTRDKYDPVCGRDGIMYFSACHAGCKTVIKKGHSYGNCSCIKPVKGTNNLTMAYDGRCASDCQLMDVFLPVFGLVILFTFITSMPALSATLRCVGERQRSFALGIQWILVRCLGTIPAPICFGALIDLTCRLWQKTCNEDGSCYVYDNNTMGYYMLLLALSGKTLSATFFILSWLLYKPPPEMPEPMLAHPTASTQQLDQKLTPSASIATGVSSATNVTNISDLGTPGKYNATYPDL